MYSLESLNSGIIVIADITNPTNNLSIKAQHPKTKAPDDPFIPITSDINVIPVLISKAYDAPINKAIGYINNLVFTPIKISVEVTANEKDNPNVNVHFFPSKLKILSINELKPTELRYNINGTSAISIGVLSTLSSSFLNKRT